MTSTDKIIDKYILQCIYAAADDRKKDSSRDIWDNPNIQTYANLMKPTPIECVNVVKITPDIRKMIQVVWRRINGELRLVDSAEEQLDSDLDTAVDEAYNTQQFSIIGFINELRPDFGHTLSEHADQSDCFRALYQSQYADIETMAGRVDIAVKMIYKFIKWISMGLLLMSWYEDSKIFKKEHFMNALILRCPDTSICDAINNDDIEFRAAQKAEKAERAAAREAEAIAKKAAADTIKTKGKSTKSPAKKSATPKNKTPKSKTPKMTPAPASDDFGFDSDDTIEDDSFNM